MTEKLDFTKSLELVKENYKFFDDYDYTLVYLNSKTIGNKSVHFVLALWIHNDNPEKRMMYVLILDDYGNRFIDAGITTLAKQIVRNKKVVQWYNIYKSGPSYNTYDTEEIAKSNITNSGRYLETRSYEYYE
jgi:hypothetical protein